MNTFECPSCKKQLDASTTVGGGSDAPKAGDLSICFSCGAWLRFTGPLSVVCLLADEFHELEPETKRMLEAGKQTVLSMKAGPP
jgi:hypothetical protein